MPITLLPWLILFSLSKVVAPVASRMDPRYFNLFPLYLIYVGNKMTAGPSQVAI
jgi:hypothetical protein